MFCVILRVFCGLLCDFVDFCVFFLRFYVFRRVSVSFVEFAGFCVFLAFFGGFGGFCVLEGFGVFWVVLVVFCGF